MKFKLSLDPHDPLPLYAQLERALKLAITSGSLSIGDQLPTVRQLAVDLQVNANTVARVYAELERQGVLATRRGVGTFVLARPTRASTVSRAQRQEELRALAERFLGEASGRGFTPEELLEQMHALCPTHKDKSHGRR